MSQDQIKARELLNKAAELRKGRMTPEQAERRRRVDARNAALQAGPIKRGPNAPADGTFGKVKSS